MIDALVGGAIVGKPVQRTGQGGRSFTTAKVRAAAGDGATVFVNVICFDAPAQAALLALTDGDSAVLSGQLSFKVWTPPNGGEPRPQLDLVAQSITTAYHVTRKREAARLTADVQT